jgi:hypothetical protein
MDVKVECFDADSGTEHYVTRSYPRVPMIGEWIWIETGYWKVWRVLWHDDYVRLMCDAAVPGLLPLRSPATGTGA